MNLEEKHNSSFTISWILCLHIMIIVEYVIEGFIMYMLK